MNDLLTTRQVQDILKVDRITVYRMLQDGRLKGVKIGQQWRFPPDGGRTPAGDPDSRRMRAIQLSPDPNFPTHCVQTIQDLFAEVSQISALVIDMQGSPLTEVSHPTRFCQMLLSSPSGKNACRASWQSFARDSARQRQRQQVLHLPGRPAVHRRADLSTETTQIGLFPGRAVLLAAARPARRSRAHPPPGRSPQPAAGRICRTRPAKSR